jgi:hypothetical protein
LAFDSRTALAHIWGLGGMMSGMISVTDVVGTSWSAETLTAVGMLAMVNPSAEMPKVVSSEAAVPARRVAPAFPTFVTVSAAAVSGIKMLTSRLTLPAATARVTKQLGA